MSGLGGLNKSPNGVVIGLVQLQLPVVETPAQTRARRPSGSARWSARRAATTPRWTSSCSPSTRCTGCRWSTAPEIMCRSTAPRSPRSRPPASSTGIWGCFSIMELNPTATRTTAASIIDDRGAIQLYYRKLHPWVPVEPWEPGNLGIPVCDGPERQQARADHLPRRHVPGDGARGRLQGRRDDRCAPPATPRRSATPGRSPTRPTRSSNLAYTASVCLCGSDGTFDSMGEGMFCNFDGTVMVEGSGRPDEIITCEVRPDLVREARDRLGRREQPRTSSTTAATSR